MPRFPHLELTARERQVAGLYLAGMSRKQIAGELGIASGTVKAHLTSIASRLGIRLRERGAIRAALKGYLDNPDTVGAIGEMAE